MKKSELPSIFSEF